MQKVSVIIPTYNRPRLLPRAVESARSAGTDVEIIVVDDASVDETAAVCRSLPDIKYLRLNRNQGAAGARNAGIVASRGEYISFLDDDDLRLPGSLDAQLRVLCAHPEAAFVCGATIIADQNYQLTGEVVTNKHQSGDVFWPIVELDFPVMGLSSLIRKECLTDIGFLDVRLKGIDDWDMFARLAARYPAVVTTDPVGVYRQPTRHSGQGSSARARQLRRVVRHQRQLLKLGPAQSASPERRRDAQRRLKDRIAETLLWNAARRLPHGEILYAGENIVLAMQLAPTLAARPRAYAKLFAAMTGELRANKNPTVP